MSYPSRVLPRTLYITSGYLKVSAKKAVTTDPNLVINSATDLYNFATTRLLSREIGPSYSLHQRRFFLVDKSEVDHGRTTMNYRTIPGTRSLHNVISIGTDGSLLVRQLSCYCASCLQHNYEQCSNKAHVEAPKKVSFGHRSDHVDDLAIDENDQHELDESVLGISHQIHRDSVVVIRPPNDSLSDYLLVHVTSEGVIPLTEDIALECGQPYIPDINIVIGYIYDYQRSNRRGLTYRGNPSKLTFVFQEHLISVLEDSQLQKLRGQNWLLSHVHHEDILHLISM